jgi:hypothetical protein
MPLGSLWLPVVVAAVAVWFVSAILHMVLKYHNADYKALPNEDGIGAAMRQAAIPPGLYMTPHCGDHGKLKDPAFQQKFKDGPVALITVLPSGVPAMGKNLVQWILYCLVVSFAVAYLARHTLNPATAGLEVMRITGTSAFLAYGIGTIPNSIWGGLPWSNTCRSLIDAAVYAVTTGLVFRYLWPAG